MEPDKFEQDIKTKLEKRTIKPSVNSWNKLEISLQSKENKKNTKFLRIISIAACIVGILFVVSLFFNKETKSIKPTIVTAPIPKIEKSNIKVEDEELLAGEDNLEKISVDKNEKSFQKKPVKTSVFKLEKEQKYVVESRVNKIDDTVSNVVLEKNLDKISNFNAENREIELVISQIENLKATHISESTSDVDLLLKNAQKELALQRIYNENIKTVDAYKLLQDVEADLDRSMKDKILETLKMNYENMKTVIAQRND